MQTIIEKAAVLIEALPYIQDFKGSIVVVKVGGSVMDSDANLERLLTDIAFMSTVGIKAVLVHGGGKAISREMEREGIAPSFVQGLRVTCGRTIRVVERVLKRGINANITRILQARGVSARPLHGDWIFTCEKKTGRDAEGNTLDWGFVGSPTGVDSRAVTEMLNAGMLPVVTPLGAGPDGAVHNMNADTAASALAMALKARKLAFISDVPGLLRDVNDPDSRIASLRVGAIETLKEAGIVGGGMLPKLESCAGAIRAGVGKVHLVDGRMPHSLLLEIFTKTGVGTEIIHDE